MYLSVEYVCRRQVQTEYVMRLIPNEDYIRLELISLKSTTLHMTYPINQPGAKSVNRLVSMLTCNSNGFLACGCAAVNAQTVVSIEGGELRSDGNDRGHEWCSRSTTEMSTRVMRITNGIAESRKICSEKWRRV